MTALFWRTIRDRQSSILIYTVIGVGLIFLYISMFPELQKQGEKIQELAKVYPESFMKAFGIDSPALMFSRLENFLAVEQYSMTWPIMLIAMIVGWGGAAIAGETEKGTIELLLSQPLSRMAIFFGKYLSGLFALIIFALVTIYSAPILAGAYNLEYSLSSFNKVAIIGVLFGWAILSLAMFFSTVFSERGRVYFASSGVLLAMYVLNLVANLKENWSDLKYFSFFHYFDANAALASNRVDGLAYWVFLGAIALLTILGALNFARRDITT